MLARGAEDNVAQIGVNVETRVTMTPTFSAHVAIHIPGDWRKRAVSEVHSSARRLLCLAREMLCSDNSNALSDV